MTADELFQQIQKKQSFLCIGLDTDSQKIPQHLLAHENPVLEFNKQIIAATHDLVVAYKPNVAFYEAMGAAGWQTLAHTASAIPEPVLRIADAKRADIGNTSALYARAFFEQMTFDAVTINPYMGFDAVAPFLTFKKKWSILLAATSNEGSQDFQFLTAGDQPLYHHVLQKSSQWASSDQMMYVVGATQVEVMAQVRKIVPHHFLLVPGIGAQGGDLASIARQGFNHRCGLLVNASRSIIYASSGKDFAQAARSQALRLQQQMAALLQSIEH